MQKVLIDGENLRHQIAHVLQVHKKISDKNSYFRFSLRSFLVEALHDEKLELVYYATRIKQPRQKIPFKLQKQITAISSANRKWVADLNNQNVEVIKAGYLRVRESTSCVHCNKKTLTLQEKGVDVGVSADLILAGNGKSENIVLASSDSDLIPAIEAANRLGVKTTYFCYAGWLNRSVAAQTYKTITFDDALVLKYFRG